MCFIKAKKILVLILTLILASQLFAPKGLAKTYYVKKSVMARTVKGKMVRLPQYAKTQAKMKKVTIAISLSKRSLNPLAKLTKKANKKCKIEYVTKGESALLLSAIACKTKKIVLYYRFENKKIRLNKKYLTMKKPRYKTKKVPHNWCKSYMSYKAITATSSPQYKMQHSKAYTDPKTGVRMADGRYCIAMGSSAANKIGTKIDLVYKGGKVVHAILGDQKAHARNGWLHPDGSAVEFLVDMNALPRNARRSGDMSTLKKFKGRIIKIRVYKK